MQVLIDDREKDNERIDTIQKYYANTEVARLPVGDIIFLQEDNPSIAFEIKTWQDFIGSIKNRRIQQEVLSMKEQYPYSFVMIYDNGKWNKKYTHASNVQIQSNIVSIMQRYKVPVVISKDLNELIISLEACKRAVNKSNEPISPPTVRNKSSNEMINVLIGLPKVGDKTARKLLDKFNKPSNVFNATEEELDEIKGLTKTAKNAILRM